jgi:hypothetical protein
LAKNSEALPLGVSAATTWLNLITIGAWAMAMAENVAAARPMN